MVYLLHQVAAQIVPSMVDDRHRDEEILTVNICENIKHITYQ